MAIPSFRRGRVIRPAEGSKKERSHGTVGSFLMRKTVTEFIGRDMKRHLEHYETETPEDTGDQASDIGALVGCHPLDSTVYVQRHQQEQSDPHRRPVKAAAHDPRQEPHQYTRTPGTDGEPLPTKVKRTVIPAMTAEDDREPFVEPVDQRITSHRSRS